MMNKGNTVLDQILDLDDASRFLLLTNHAAQINPQCSKTTPSKNLQGTLSSYPEGVRFSNSESTLIERPDVICDMKFLQQKTHRHLHSRADAYM